MSLFLKKIVFIPVTRGSFVDELSCYLFQMKMKILTSISGWAPLTFFALYN